MILIIYYLYAFFYKNSSHISFLVLIHPYAPTRLPIYRLFTLITIITLLIYICISRSSRMRVYFIYAQKQEIGTELSHDVLTQLTYHFNGRTAQPLGPLQPQDMMSRHRVPNNPFDKVSKELLPVIPGVPFIR